MHSVDSLSKILRFFNGVFIFNSKNYFGSVLAKKRRFARNWPLSRTIFAALFLLDFKVLHPSGGSFEKSS
jgi:hypothetical protein